MRKINPSELVGTLEQNWKHLVVATLIDYDVKIVGIVVEFMWPENDQTDELFYVLSGTLEVDVRDTSTRDGWVEACAGELVVVPAAVRQRTRMPDPTPSLVIEPATTVNTGNEESGFTHAA